MKIYFNNHLLTRGIDFSEEPLNLSFSSSKEIELSPLLESSQMGIFERGNAKMSIQFESQREHESHDAAMRFILEKPRLMLEQNGELTLDLEDAAGSIYHFEKASLGRLESRVENCTSFIHYRLTSSAFGGTKALGLDSIKKLFFETIKENDS